MKKIVLLIELLFTFLILSPAFAAKDEHFNSTVEMISQQNNICKSIHSADKLQECLTKQNETLEKELRLNYETFIKSLDHNDRIKLRYAQNTWILFKKANCAFSANEYEVKKLQTLILLSCYASMIKTRAEELKQLHSDYFDEN